jgi:RsiW-degrading membrane proteinase PrsW (M82 family)
MEATTSPECGESVVRSSENVSLWMAVRLFVSNFPVARLCKFYYEVNCNGQPKSLAVKAYFITEFCVWSAHCLEMLLEDVVSVAVYPRSAAVPTVELSHEKRGQLSGYIISIHKH